MIEGVERMSIIVPIAWLIGYLVTHVAIGFIVKNLEKALVKEPENEEVKNNLKTGKLVFKWWPFAYVIIILISFLAF